MLPPYPHPVVRKAEAFLPPLVVLAGLTFGCTIVIVSYRVLAT